MNKARIEELVQSFMVSSGDREMAIRAALTTLARECYEEAARECGIHADGFRHGSTAGEYRAILECAAAIRALAEEVGK